MYDMRNTVWDSSSDSSTRSESAPPGGLELPLGHQAPPAPNVLSQAAIVATDMEKIWDLTSLFPEPLHMERCKNWNTAEHFPPDLTNTNVDSSARTESVPPVAPYFPPGYPAPPAPNILSQGAIVATDKEKIWDSTSLFQEPLHIERRKNWNTAERFPPDLTNTNVDSSARTESVTPVAPYFPPRYPTPPAPDILRQGAIEATDNEKILDRTSLFQEALDMDRQRNWNTAEYFPPDWRNTHMDSSTRRGSAPPVAPHLPLGYQAPPPPNALSQAATRRELVPPAAPYLPLGYQAPPAPNVLSQPAIEATDKKKIWDRTALSQEPFGMEKHRNWNIAKHFPSDLRNTNVDSSTRESAPPAAPYSALGYQAPPAPNVSTQGAIEAMDKEKIWLFMDRTGSKGPFALETLRKCKTAGQLPQNLRIWKTTQDRKESIFLNDALAERFQKERELSLGSSYAEVVKTYAQVVRSNPTSTSISASSNLAINHNSVAKDLWKNGETISWTDRGRYVERSGSLGDPYVNQNERPQLRDVAAGHPPLEEKNLKLRRAAPNNIPCRYYQKGYCKKGDGCDFWHC